MDRVRNSGLGAALVLLLLLVLWWQAGQWYAGRLLTERRSEAALEVSLRGNIISSIINRRFARLQGLAAFTLAEADDPDFAESFLIFAERLYEGTNGIRDFAVAPAGEIRYVYPEAENAQVLGYTPLFDPRPEVRADVRRAMRTGNIVLSGPTELIQGGLGLVARQAVYQEGAFWGLVNVVLDVPVILEEAGISDLEGEMTYALRDSEGRVFFGNPDVFNNDPVINVLELPEGAWELGGVPAAGWPATLQPALRLFQLGGLLVVGLLTSVAYLTINRQVRLQEAVRQRTQELAESNRLLERRVHERTQELETLLIENSRLYEQDRSLAVLKERQRLARELHDSVSQALYGISLGTLTARRLMDQDREIEVGEALEYTHSLAEGALTEMRALIFELRPESLVQEGLAAALEKQAAVLKARHRIVVETDLCQEPEAALDIKEAVYRVAQEALHNVVKHAGADRVRLDLLCRDDFLELQIEDNGRGFAPDQRFPGHLGLRSMRERIEQVGGSFVIESFPGKGTEVRARVPVEQSVAAAV